MSASDLPFTVSVGLLDSKPILRITPRKAGANTGEKAYELSYDRKTFTIVPLTTAGENPASDQEEALSVTDTGSETLFQILRAESAMLQVSVHPIGTGRVVDLVVSLADCLHGKPLTQVQFQQAQTDLEHTTVINLSPIGCSYEDALSEVMSTLRTSVVLDKQTSWSKTSWLSGAILDKRVLIVLDAVGMKTRNRLSLDAWSDMSHIADFILGAIAKTELGRTSPEMDEFDVSWQLLTDTSSPPGLLITVTTNAALDTPDPLYLTVDFHEVLSEELEAGMPRGMQRLTIPIDIADVTSSWHGTLDETFLKVFISDAYWKDLEKSRTRVFTWRDAIRQQVETRLGSNRRFSGFEDLGQSLHLAPSTSHDTARRIFTEFCLERSIHGCANERLSDHCARASLLSGLVICFEPPRGLSGYLDMVVGGNTDPAGMGSARTWRDHLSQIVNSAEDFTPKPVKLSATKKARRPGRPPLQVVPMTRLPELFDQFVRQPERVVCTHCRFSPTHVAGKPTSVL